MNDLYREEQNYWIQAKHKTTETNFGLLDKLLCLIRTSQLKKKNPFKNVNCYTKCDILEGKQTKTNQKLTIRTTSTKTTTKKH